MVLVAGAAQLKVYFSINGELCINVYGLRVTGTPVFGQSLIDTIGASVKAVWGSNMGPHCSVNCQLLRVGIRDLRQDHLPEWRETAASVVGTGVGDGLPSKDALCVTLRTAQTGKSFRGRTYLSGWTEAENTTSGVAANSAVTAALNYLSALNATSLQPSGFLIGVLTLPQEEKIVTEVTNHANGTSTSRQLSHQTAKPGGITQVTAFESRNAAWESQRRRGNQRGGNQVSALTSTSVLAL